MSATIMATLLSLAPVSPTDDAAPFEVADIAVEIGESPTLTAYDADGEVLAEVVVWSDADGRRRLDANFVDGLYLTAIQKHRDVSVESNNHPEVADRIAIMQTALPQVTHDEVIECAAGILGLAASAGTGPLGTMLGVVGFAVTCGKTLAEELNDSDDHDQDPAQDEDK